jgi:hypothetical protein
MATTTIKDIQKQIEILAANLEEGKASSLDQQEALLKIREEIYKIEEKFKGIGLKNDQEDNLEYQFREEENQDDIEEANQELTEQLEKNKEQLHRAVKEANPSSEKKPTQKEVHEIKQNHGSIENYKQEFENSKSHLMDQSKEIKAMKGKGIAEKMEMKGQGILSQSKTMEESLSNKNIIECANDSQKLTQESLYGKSGASPVPTPAGGTNKEEDEYSSSYASMSITPRA